MPFRAVVSFFAVVALVAQPVAVAQDAAESSAAPPPDPRSIEARALIESERHGEALIVLRELTQDKEAGAPSADALFMLGFSAVSVAEGEEEEAEKDALLDEAADALWRILASNPAEARARLELSRALFLRGEDGLARAHFGKFLAASPHLAESPIVAEAREHLDNGRIAAALPILRFLSAYSHLSFDPEVMEARRMVLDGAPKDALPILRRLAPGHPDETDVLFLLGLAAFGVAEGESDEAAKEALLDEAIDAFRRMLVSRPDLVRARLELARAFFAKGEDDLARENFEVVLAAGLPAQAAGYVFGFLAQMDARRRWSSYFNSAVLPEARIERNRTIYQYGGLPLRFGAVEKTGIGLRLSGGVSYKEPLGGDWSMIYSAHLERTEYKRSKFDETKVRLNIAQKKTFSPGNSFDINIGVLRTFDDRLVNDEFTLGLGAARQWTRRLSSSAGGSATWDKFGSGPDLSASVGGAFYFLPTLRGGFRAAITRDAPRKQRSLRRSREISANAVAVLPRGFTFNIKVILQETRSETVFGTLGRGNQIRRVRTFEAGLLRRDFTIFGFSPKLSYVRQFSDSNYQLNIYQLDSYQLNFQRQF